MAQSETPFGERATIVSSIPDAEGAILKPLLALLLFACLIVTAGILVFQQYRDEIKQESEQQLDAIASLKVSTISRWIAERRGDAELLKNSIIFNSEVVSWLESGADSKAALAERVRDHLDALLRVNGQFGYASIALLDANGVPRLSVGGDLKGIGPYELALLKKSLQSGRVGVSDIERNAAKSGDDLITLVAPLFVDGAAARRAIGSILFRIDPYRYLFPLVRNWPTPSPSSETLLVRREGDQVLFLNRLRHQSGSEPTLRFALDSPRLPAAMAVKGVSGMVDGFDYRGTAVVAALRKVPDTPWFMVAKTDRSEIYAPVNRLGKWVAGLVGILFVAATLFMAWWIAQNRRRLASLRQAHQSELERQALTRRLDYLAKYANDIIVLSDSNYQFVDANDRALDAYGYSREAFLKLHVADLLAPESRELFDSRAEIIFNSGGHRFESLHIRRDGTVFPVESSVRLVEVEGRRFYQNIIRDISERRRAEQALSRVNRALRLLSECNAAVAQVENERQLLDTVCNLIVETGGYRMAWAGLAQLDDEKKVVPVAKAGADDGYCDSLDVNWADTERGRGTSGTAVRTGTVQKIRDFAIEPAMAPWKDAALARGYRSCISLPLKFDGAVFGVMSIYSTNVDAFESIEELKLLEELADNLGVGIGALRTREQGRQAAQLLAQSEARFRQMFDEASDAMAYADAETGIFLNVNRSFAELLGFERSELIGMPQKNLHPEARERQVSDSFEGHRGERSGQVIETQVINKSGELIDVAIKASLIEMEGRMVVLGSFRDITNRKSMERELQRQRDFIRQVIDADPSMIFVKDSDGRFLLANLAMANAYGLTPESVVGKYNWQIVADMRETARYDDKNHQVIEQRRELVSNEPATLPSGRTLWMRTVRKPLVQPDGAVQVLTIATDITELKESEGKLAESYSRLQQLSSHLESLRENEQARIARELHDEIGALLAALNISVSLMQQKISPQLDELAPELQSMEKLVSSGFQTMRDLVAKMRPQLLDELGLIPAVEYYLKKFQRNTGIGCVAMLPDDDLDLEVNRASTVFRILQESLTNVAKHSHADRVLVRLRRRGSLLFLTVSDNGSGFDVDAGRGDGFGLLGIKERALMAGGKSRIRSVPGRGTTVSAVVPYVAPSDVLAHPVS